MTTEVAKTTKPVTRRAVRVGPVSVVVRPWMVVVNIVLLALLLLLFCVDIGRGELSLSVGQVIDALSGAGTRSQRFIVNDVRLPRALVGLLVGIALGISGAITQSVLRNPLASPDILGITAGASVGAVGLIVGFGAGVGIGVPTAALIGGFVTAGAIYLLAWQGTVEGYRLVLIGIGTNAMMLAMVGWLFVKANTYDVGTIQLWLTGSLDQAGWSNVRTTAIGVVVFGVVALVSAPAMATLRFGDDKARSLGVRLQARQGVVLLSAVALAGLATAASGPIGFVALAAPQIARRLLRTPGEPIVGSALVGGVLVLASDIIARTLLPVGLPVGIVTAALGGPFLLYLLVSNNRKASI